MQVVGNHRARGDFAKWICSVLVVIGICGLPAFNLQVVAQSEAGRPPLMQSAIVFLSESLEVPARQSGVIKSLKIRAGGQVQVGDLIADVDASEHELKLLKSQYEHELTQKVAGSESDILYAQKSLEVAQKNVARSEQANLRVQNTIPAAKLEKQKLEREQATLLLQKALQDRQLAIHRTKLTEADIRSAELELSKTRVISPKSGRVISVERRTGEWVQPGEVICEIARTDTLKLVGFVPASDAAQIRPGQSVTVRFSYDWIKNKEFDGKVTYISPRANPVNLAVEVWVEFANLGGEIRTGLKGDVYLR